MGAIIGLLGEEPTIATKSMPEQQLVSRNLWCMFVKASNINVFKCNAIVFRGKCKAVKDSRPYGKKQSRKEPSVMETACVTQIKKQGKVRQEG